jgi:hypothetical protein
MLATKSSSLYLNRGKLTFTDDVIWNATEKSHKTPLHLYVLSDELTKGEKCWHYNHIFKTISKKASTGYRKIISTTDKSISAGQDRFLEGYMVNTFPQPSLEFILIYVDAFNSGKPIVNILVEYKSLLHKGEIIDDSYPKDFPTHTLKISKEDTITIKKLEETWEDIWKAFKATGEQWDKEFYSWVTKYYDPPTLKK